MNTSIISQDKLILDKLMEFYNKDGNLLKMLNIINGKTKISLRIVDWFVTNYAKKNYTIIGQGKDRFKVHFGYKQKLKAYNKKRFDPFCRWDRITIPYNENTLIETTIGQLNFFKWAMEKHIIDYIEEHYDEIENDMTMRNSISKKFKHTLNTATNTTQNNRTHNYVISTNSKHTDAVHDAAEHEEDKDNEDCDNHEQTNCDEECEHETDNTHILHINNTSGKINTNTKTRKKREELSISAIKSIKKENVEIVINFN
jgi:hypothetical protein